LPCADIYRQGVSDWLKPLRSLLTPVSIGLFAGALDINKIPAVVDRIKFRLSVLFGIWKERDYRDWEAILAWTKDLMTSLEL
jgi:hypothetical protein